MVSLTDVEPEPAERTGTEAGTVAERLARGRHGAMLVEGYRPTVTR